MNSPSHIAYTLLKLMFSRCLKKSYLRPIKMLSSIKEVFKKEAYEQLIQHLERNQVMNSAQFRGKYRCEAAHIVLQMIG